MASGTISGPTPDSYGSMLELSWRGENPYLARMAVIENFCWMAIRSFFAAVARRMALESGLAKPVEKCFRLFKQCVSRSVRQSGVRKNEHTKNLAYGRTEKSFLQFISKAQVTGIAQAWHDIGLAGKFLIEGSHPDAGVGEYAFHVFQASSRGHGSSEMDLKRLP